MRQIILALMAFLFITAQLAARATDLIQQVPLQDPAYQQIRLLGNRGMLSNGWEESFSTTSPRVLYRLDFAYYLIEPLERFMALSASIKAESTPTTEKQQRQQTLAYIAVSSLSPADYDALLNATSRLLTAFHIDLEKLKISPQFAVQAEDCLRFLRQPTSRPWLKNSLSPEREPMITWNASLNTDPVTDSTATFPLTMAPSIGAIGMIGPSPDGDVVGVIPVKSMQLALSVTFGDIHLFGRNISLTSDPSKLLRPETIGKQIFGLDIPVGHFRNLDISGRIEYHLIHNGEPGSSGTTSGKAIGLGITW